MTVIGLTGGIASGKSYVAGLLAERDAVVLDADRYAHEALDEAPIRDALVARWGDSILRPDGAIDRSAIAGRVFGDEQTAERRFLEGLVHPRVHERLVESLAEARRDGAPAAVLDVPLLIEAGWVDDCDVVLFVDTPDEVRRARAEQRGWTAADLSRREAAQTPVATKRDAADQIVPGDDPQAARQALESSDWAWWRDAP